MIMLTSKSFALVGVGINNDKIRDMVDTNDSSMEPNAEQNNNTDQSNNTDVNNDTLQKIMLREQLSALHQGGTNHRCLSWIVSSPAWIWTIMKCTFLILFGFQCITPNGFRTRFIIGSLIPAWCYDIIYLCKTENTHCKLMACHIFVKILISSIIFWISLLRAIRSASL